MKFFTQNKLWMLLIAFILVGWFYPTIGFLAIVCMSAPVIYGYLKGKRSWCATSCPRGSFLSQIIAKASFKGKIPKIINNIYFRYTSLVLLLAYFTFGVVSAWGNFGNVGFVFVRTVLVTTLLAITLGIKYQPRTWCAAVCPMGTLSTLAIKQRKHLKTSPQ